MEAGEKCERRYTVSCFRSLLFPRVSVRKERPDKRRNPHRSIYPAVRLQMSPQRKSRPWREADAQMPVSDQTLREVAINNGEYNVGVSVAHRATPPGHTPGAFNGGPIEHSDITEIYEVLSGHATFVTGGTIENPKVNPTHGGPGPSVSGTGVENGVTREVGPGDVVIIPPNTPHFFGHIDSEITYLIFRVDTHHIWTMPYKPHKPKKD